MGTKDTTPETPQEVTMDTATRLSLRHGHGLDTVAGYRVVVTTDGETILDSPELVADLVGANRYGEALDIVHAIRRLGRWAVIDTRYDCGCWSDNRDNLDEARAQTDAETLTDFGVVAPSAPSIALTLNALADELGRTLRSMEVSALGGQASAETVAAIFARWAPHYRFPVRFRPSNWTGPWTVRMGLYAGSNL
jgi:hypothetical protein